MIERFTRRARRAVFFARWKASKFGSPRIDSEHLLLGVLHENHVLAAQFFRPPTTPESLCEQILISRPSEKESSIRDLRLSKESKRTFAYAAEEAELLHHRYISPEHLALGLLREDQSLSADLLRQQGITADDIRKAVRED